MDLHPQQLHFEGSLWPEVCSIVVFARTRAISVSFLFHFSCYAAAAVIFKKQSHYFSGSDAQRGKNH